MQSHNSLAVFGFIMAALALTACGTVSRESYDPARPSQSALLPPDGIRVLANDGINVSALGREVSARLSAGGSARHTILALSGGGASGAYGAGVIAGWTETGSRPEFDVVTGISTGALAAPFAFLGPRWDDSLKRAYTDGRTQNLLSWQNFAAFFAPSLFNPRSLRKLVDRYIIP